MKLYKNLFLIIFVFLSIQNSYSQTYEELKRMQDQYKKALERQSLKKSNEIVDVEQKAALSATLPDRLLYTRKEIESLLLSTQELINRLNSIEDSVEKMPYIGYELFSEKDSIPFWQNLPIPDNYVLGPGDEIIISLWGEVDGVYETVINRDGQFYVENIGMVNIAGKNIDEAKNYILSRYSKVYSTLVGSKPKSFLDISLGKLKSINVHFVGSVKIPGVHMIHPFSNIVMGLNQAGGITKKGSLRRIQVIRNDEILMDFDLYSYLFKGKSLSDIRLMDQDIVLVLPRISTIPLGGEVIKPGYYELEDGETVNDILSFAGGKNRFSSPNVFLFRNSHNSFENDYYLNDKESLTFKIFQGDSLHVPKSPNLEKFVEIDGQIKSPGRYPYKSGMTLRSLIELTMSTYDKDFEKTMDLRKIIVFRKNPDGKKSLSITVNLLEDDFRILNGDHINIPKSDLYTPIEKIIITGEIKNPGLVALDGQTTLKQAISTAGGLSQYAHPEGIEIFRDSLKVAWQNNSLLLMDGDSVNVLKKTGLVFVKGEVNNPGYISFDKNLSLKKYIDLAGGFTSFAEERNIYITYPNGMSKNSSRLLTPKVTEGSIIYVKERSLSGHMGNVNRTSFTQLTAQASSIATTLLSLMLLMNQLNGS